MKFATCSLLLLALLLQGNAYKFDSMKVEKEVEKTASADDKKNDKRGAAVEIQASESAYITPSPPVHLSHGPTIVPAVSVTPGIVYAAQKEVVATASPSQVYARPSPHLTKVADVVSPAPISNLLVSNVHHQPLYQTLPKVAINAQTYAVTAPVAAHLAYSKHQILPQQEYHHQPQVHYAAYSQPQPFYVHPQQYVQPQVSYVQPHTQAQLIHIQPQAYHAQPQIYHTQPQIYHTQPQVYHSQPQVYHAQPQIVHAQHVPYVQQQNVYPQPVAYHQPQYPVVVAQPVTKLAYAQPQVYSHGQQVKGDAVSYTSFAQSELAGVHYPNPLKIIPAPSLVPQAPIIAKQNYQQGYQHGYQNYYNQPQLQKLGFTQNNGYSQNNGYNSQYYGKNVQNNQNAYNSYSH